MSRNLNNELLNNISVKIIDLKPLHKLVLASVLHNILSMCNQEKQEKSVCVKCAVVSQVSFKCELD
jgi:hypothetical protein